MPKRDKELPPEAVRALAEAEKRRLEKKEIDLLQKTLSSELTKKIRLQTNTPTQIVNTFLLENYELSNKLTPRSFSEETFFLIMQWGVHKASKVS